MTLRTADFRYGWSYTVLDHPYNLTWVAELQPIVFG